MAKVYKAERLMSLEPSLREVIVAAIADFDGPGVVIVETLRTKQRQEELVRAGASRTLKSKHLVHPGGYSHAVDVAFMVGDEVRFDWPLYYDFAEKVRLQARKHSVKMTWGAIWDTFLADVTGQLTQAHAAYVARFAAKRGRKPLADGPHFQLG
jgi:peptidoglycan L-alanyl-D-glutamate endopeptidase CwlK